MTTITVAPEVKRELGHLKPDALTWDDFLAVLLESVDPDRFERVVRGLLDAQREQAVARARERYRRARARPDELFSAPEARKRVRALQAGKGASWRAPVRSDPGQSGSPSSTRPKRSPNSRSRKTRSA